MSQQPKVPLRILRKKYDDVNNSSHPNKSEVLDQIVGMIKEHDVPGIVEFRDSLSDNDDFGNILASIITDMSGM